MNRLVAREIAAFDRSPEHSCNLDGMNHSLVPQIIHGLDDPGAVLDLLNAETSDAERALERQAIAQALARGADSDCFCTRALAGQHLLGAAFAQKIAGHAAVVYPPLVERSAPAGLAPQLVQSLDDPLRSAGVRLAQVLLTLDQVSEESSFLSAGYVSAATLLYMVAETAAVPAPPRASELTLEPATPTSQPQLESLIDATYEGTLDCPLLNGLRTASDVIAGYRAVGTHRPELWFVARDNERDLGCLLLADHPQDSNLELVYLGLIPAARGRGLGLWLARHALWLARQLGRERVVLAVDAANAPAIGVYEAAGFFGFDQRQLMIKRI